MENRNKFIPSSRASKITQAIIDNQIKQLYKSFLIELEDLVSEYEIDEEIFTKYRKKILDSGNDCVREVNRNLSVVIMKFK